MENEIEIEKGVGWSERSAEIGQLIPALIKMHNQIAPVVKDSTNPYFKSKYADLASIWEAISEPLTKNGLFVLQEPSGASSTLVIDDALVSYGSLTLTTTIIHSSGEYVRSAFTVPVVSPNPQGFGSAVTYARRYALQSVFGIAPEDDDGNAACQKVDIQKSARPPKLQAVPKLTENKVQEGQVYDFWYSFETLKSGNLKGFQAACAMAKKQEACRIEDQDTGTIAYCCMKPLEPREKFDKFLWTKKGPAEKISEVVDETKEK